MENPQREMSLVEWCNKLPDSHRVNTELKKMQKALVGLLEDCKLNLEAIGGCDHDVGICVCGVISLIADAEQALEDLEG